MQNSVSKDKVAELEQRLLNLGVTEDTLVERFVRG
ncbi:MAG: hypothetical protein RLZZ522_475, partial [Verrucomicrobiota bacterium]